MCKTVAPLIKYGICRHSVADPTRALTSEPCAAVAAGHKRPCQTYSHRPEDIAGRAQRLVRSDIREVEGLCPACAADPPSAQMGSTDASSEASVSVHDEDLVAVDEDVWGPAAADTPKKKKTTATATKKKTVRPAYLSSSSRGSLPSSADTDPDDDEIVTSPAARTPSKRKRVVLSSSEEEEEEETPSKRRVLAPVGLLRADMTAVFARVLAPGPDTLHPGLSSAFADAGRGLGGGPAAPVVFARSGAPSPETMGGEEEDMPARR